MDLEDQKNTLWKVIKNLNNLDLIQNTLTRVHCLRKNIDYHRELCEGAVLSLMEKKNQLNAIYLQQTQIAIAVLKVICSNIFRTLNWI